MDQQNLLFEQLKGIKDLGDGHALRVAAEIVENGRSVEVEEKKKDPKFRAFRVCLRSECRAYFSFDSLKAFCNIYGVGPSMAKKWYAMGLRTIEDVKKRFDHLDVNNEMTINGIGI